MVFSKTDGQTDRQTDVQGLVQIEQYRVRCATPVRIEAY